MPDNPRRGYFSAVANEATLLVADDAVKIEQFEKENVESEPTALSAADGLLEESGSSCPSWCATRILFWLRTKMRRLWFCLVGRPEMEITWRFLSLRQWLCAAGVR